MATAVDIAVVSGGDNNDEDEKEVESNIPMRVKRRENTKVKLSFASILICIDFWYW